MSSGQFSFTSSWKEASEFDQTARQISSFLFPKRRLSARCKSDQAGLSVTFWTEGDRYFLLYVTKDKMQSEQIGLVLDMLSAAIDQIGIPLEHAKSHLVLNFFAHDYDPNFSSRLMLILPQAETFSWLSSRIEQKEFIMMKETKTSPRPDQNANELSNRLRNSHSLITSELTSEELSEFTQLGLDLRKLH